jgi:transcription termination factor Rho
MMFSILREHAEEGYEIGGDGVLEVLQDGFGFLRSPRRTICRVRMISTSAPTCSANIRCAPATRSRA